MAVDRFWEAKAEVVTVRRRIDLLIWSFPLGCAVVIATWAVFRYAG